MHARFDNLETPFAYYPSLGPLKSSEERHKRKLPTSKSAQRATPESSAMGTPRPSSPERLSRRPYRPILGIIVTVGTELYVTVMGSPGLRSIILTVNPLA